MLARLDHNHMGCDQLNEWVQNQLIVSRWVVRDVYIVIRHPLYQSGISLKCFCSHRGPLISDLKNLHHTVMAWVYGQTKTCEWLLGQEKMGGDNELLGIKTYLIQSDPGKPSITRPPQLTTIFIAVMNWLHSGNQTCCGKPMCNFVLRQVGESENVSV